MQDEDAFQVFGLGQCSLDYVGRVDAYPQPDSKYELPEAAYPVEAVDTTGCGDVFHAGFIYGLVNGWDAEKSLDLGAWVAAQVSLRLGGRSGIPTLEALRQKYKAPL